MTKEKMIYLKEGYVIQDDRPFLCYVAEDLGIVDEFQEYLMNNLDDTMINLGYTDKSVARWRSLDVQSRLDWLDKHIKLLGSV